METEKKNKPQPKQIRNLWVALAFAALILLGAIVMVAAFFVSPTTDVWAHYFPGLIVILISLIALTEATGKVDRVISNVFLAVIFIGGGIYLSGVVFGRLQLNPLDYKQLDITNFQHFLIYWSMIFTGILLVTTCNFRRINLGIRAVWLTIASVLLFIHAQPEEFGQSMAWLTPYHRTMSVILFVAAASYISLIFVSKRWLYFVPGTCLLIVGIMLMSYRDPVKRAAPCVSTNNVVEVKIDKAAFTPNEITANRCDILRIVGEDQYKHGVAFGNHENHQHYGLYDEQVINPDQYLDITLSEPGKFRIHDHLNEGVRASLVINP